MFVRSLFFFCVVLACLNCFAQKPSVGPLEKQIKALIQELGGQDFQQRKRAEAKLVSFGAKALPNLMSTFKSGKNPETVYRVRQVIKAIVDQSRTSTSTQMKLCLIKPGEFVMGSGQNEQDRHESETPHKVKLSNYFLLGQKEVTQKQFQGVMRENPSWHSATGNGKDKVDSLDTSAFPVDSVSWYEAIRFCNKLSENEGLQQYYRLSEIEQAGGKTIRAKVSIQGGTGYRLPTEAEWEYACRAGTTSPYHFGKKGYGGNFQYVESVGYGRIRSESLGRTDVVGSYKPNAWGLYDMHGNVAEWCWDWYSHSYYSRAPELDPTGPQSGILSYKVLRGGSFLVKQSSCRSATRFYKVPRSADYFIGFRIARDLSKDVIAAMEIK